MIRPLFCVLVILAPVLALAAVPADYKGKPWKDRPGQRNNADGYAADLDPSGSAWYSPPGLRAVRNIQRRVAGAEGVAYWDWVDRMGGPGYAEDWARATPPLMRGDHVHFTNDGLSIWYGTSDAPAPGDDRNAPRSGAALVVGVSPPSPINTLNVRYRVDGGQEQR